MFQNKTYPLLEDIRNSTQGRNQILDFARGLAIILMVYGHMEINGYLRVIIYSFHMPLFLL